MPTKDERKCCIIQVSIRDIVDYMTLHKGITSMDFLKLDKYDLPEDVEIVGVHYNISYEAFDIRIRSDTFEIISKGNMAPNISPKKFIMEIKGEIKEIGNAKPE